MEFQEKTAVIGFAGGYCEARIMYNYGTEKWDVDFFGPASEDFGRPFEVDERRGTTSFDTPMKALLWIAEKELGWKNDRGQPESDAISSTSSGG